MLREKFRRGLDSDHLGVGGATRLVFDLALIPCLLGDDQAMGNAQQISVSKFDPWSLGAPTVWSSS